MFKVVHPLIEFGIKDQKFSQRLVIDWKRYLRVREKLTNCNSKLQRSEDTKNQMSFEPISLFLLLNLHERSQDVYYSIYLMC